MWSHSSIRATAGPSVLLQTRRDRHRETVTTAHSNNGPAGLSETQHRLDSGNERSVVTENECRGLSDVCMAFSKLHKGTERRSKGQETEELLLDCSSIWIFVVLPEERLQSCIPGAVVGVRNQIESPTNIDGFSFLGFHDSLLIQPSHHGTGTCV